LLKTFTIQKQIFVDAAAGSQYNNNNVTSQLDAIGLDVPDGDAKGILTILILVLTL